MVQSLGERPLAKMTGLPDKLIETPDTYARREPLMDVLDDILGSLRLTGGVVDRRRVQRRLLRRCRSSRPSHFAPFFPVPEKLISYHYVRSGRLIVEVDGLPPMTLEAGGIAILPRNDPHRLASRAGLAPDDANEISEVTADGRPPGRRTGTDGAEGRGLVRLPRDRRARATIRCSTRCRRC